uniref:Uncharacterized protein n=1 Tax=Anguilla anguilla TaxID=7936 RepID=A0A0E9Q435_ANGAN
MFTASWLCVNVLVLGFAHFYPS